MLWIIHLNLEMAGNFGKVEGKRPVFKVYTSWMDVDEPGWFEDVRGELWSCKLVLWRI